MSDPAIPLFHSAGHPGFSPEVAEHPECRQARKLVHEVQVSFADDERTVQTMEGVVHAKAGDAILTGIGGERWRVSRRHFPDKYRPVAPTEPGETGAYVSLPNRVLALRMDGTFEVQLADGVSRLRGESGDWLVDYGDGSLGIVAADVFSTTYEIIG